MFLIANQKEEGLLLYISVNNWDSIETHPFHTIFLLFISPIESIWKLIGFIDRHFVLTSGGFHWRNPEYSCSVSLPGGFAGFSYNWHCFPDFYVFTNICRSKSSIRLLYIPSRCRWYYLFLSARSSHVFLSLLESLLTRWYDECIILSTAG